MRYEKKNDTRLTLIGLFVLLILTLSTTSTMGQTTGDSDTSETRQANELVDKANVAIRAAKELQTQNEGKVGAYKAALNARNFRKATQILDGVIQDIGTVLEYGDTAASALEQASRLQINPTFKAYLELRGQSIRQRIQSYKELRSVLGFTKGMLNARTPEAVNEALPKIKESQDAARLHEKKADELEAQSDKIRRENPDAFLGVTPEPTPVKSEAVPAKKTPRTAKPRKRKGKA